MLLGSRTRCLSATFVYDKRAASSENDGLRGRVICASSVCHETAPLLAPIPIQADRPTTLSATANLYSPRCRYCVAHECRDRRRDRNSQDGRQGTVEPFGGCGDRATARCKYIWCERIRGCSYRAVKSVTVPIRGEHDAVFSVQHLFCSFRGNAIVISHSDPLDASL